MELFSENTKLEAVIHKDYSLLPVINRLGIKLGFGDTTIKQQCEQLNIDVNFFVEIINVFHNESYFPEKRLLDFSVTLVVEYLIQTHRYYTEYIIPENDRLIRLFLSTCDSDCPENKLVMKFYQSFMDEFMQHIKAEEREVFPYVLRLNQHVNQLLGTGQSFQLNPKISQMGFEKEHTGMDEKMYDLKNIIIKYLPPNYDLNIGNALLTNLFMFEKDVKNHSRIEDMILLPKIKQLEKQISGYVD